MKFKWCKHDWNVFTLGMDCVYYTDWRLAEKDLTIHINLAWWYLEIRIANYEQ